MKQSIIFSIIAVLSLTCFSLHGDQFLLDQVMSKDDQKKTGVANLSKNQKAALEAWLNKTFILRQEEKPPATKQLYLSINIDNGQKLQLSDNSIWEISPNDVPTAAVWITPFPIKITPSNDPTYPSLLVNINTGVGVKARQVPASSQVPAPPPATPQTPTPPPAAPQMQKP